MSTPYEVSLRDGQVLVFDRDKGGFQVRMGLDPSDDVLMGLGAPAPSIGWMSYKEAAKLVDWLDSQIEAYGELGKGKP